MTASVITDTAAEDDLAATLSPYKTMQLTTFKKDGTPVATPVTVAVDGGRILFRTYTDTWKFKRLSRNPLVEVTPSSFRGEALGPPLPGSARRLEGEDVKAARKALKRRSPLLQGVFVPTLHRIMRYTTVHYELLERNAGSA